MIGGIAQVDIVREDYLSVRNILKIYYELFLYKICKYVMKKSIIVFLKQHLRSLPTYDKENVQHI